MTRQNSVKTAGIEHHQEPSEKQQQRLVNILRVLLADELMLYSKLRNYHLNVIGMSFYSLHMTFEKQLDEIVVAMDQVRERIRQYGSYEQVTLDEFVHNTYQGEISSEYSDAHTMVANLAAEHEAIIRFLREDIQKIGDDFGESSLCDLLTTFIQQHQKMAWRLRMHLGH
jgi:starvation-inducible DNA-binding protein